MFNIFLTTTSNKIKAYHALSFEIKDETLTVTIRHNDGNFAEFPEIKTIKMHRIKHMCIERATEELK